MPEGRGRGRGATRTQRLKRSALVLAAGLAVLGLATTSAPQTAEDPVPVDRCRSIQEPGSYRLTADLAAGSSPCLAVRASDVALDGAGHEVAANGSQATGVAVDRAVTNVSVHDLRLRGFQDAGLAVTDASDVRIERATVPGGGEGAAGLRVTDASGVVLRDNRATSTGTGVHVRGSTDVRVAGTAATDNLADGYRIADTAEVRLVDSEAARNGGAGLRLDGTPAAEVERGRLVDNEQAVSVRASPDARLTDTDLGPVVGASIAATGGTPLELEAVALGNWTLGGELRDVRLRGTGLLPSPDSPNAALDLQLEAEATAADAYANLTAGYPAKAVPDHEEPTMRWWRWDGDTWDQAPEPNRVDVDASSVTVNATRGGAYAPVVEQDVEPPVTVDDAPEGWVDRGVELALDATDDRSGVATTTVRRGDGPERPYEEPIRLEAEGVHTVGYRSTDEAGNREPWRTTTVRIDRTPPSLEASVSGLSAQGGGFVAPVTVSLTASDGASGLDRLRYRLDGGAWTTYGEPVVVEEPGEHELAYRARDLAGNQATRQLDAFRLTDEVPAGAAGPAGPAELEVDDAAGEDGSARVTVLNVTDPGELDVVLVHPDGRDEVLGPGDGATWDTRSYRNGYYEVEAVDSDGGGDPVPVASTSHLVENPRASATEALLAVAGGVAAIAAVQAVATGSGWLVRLLAYLARVVRRALGIEYRERTKEHTALRARLVREGGAALVAAGALATAVTLAGIPRWVWTTLLPELPTLGGAAVVFSVVWYGGDWLIARTTGQSPRYVLLGSGLASLAVTTLLLRSPFGTPGYVEKRSSPIAGDATDVSFQAKRTLADLGLIASAALVFLPVMRSVSYAFGETGLLLVVMTLATGAVPIPPLPNHQVFAWNKFAGLVVLVAGVALYVAWQVASMPDAVLAGLGLAGVGAVVAFLVGFGTAGEAADVA